MQSDLIVLLMAKNVMVRILLGKRLAKGSGSNTAIGLFLGRIIIFLLHTGKPIVALAASAKDIDARLLRDGELRVTSCTTSSTRLGSMPRV